MLLQNVQNDIIAIDITFKIVMNIHSIEAKMLKFKKLFFHTILRFTKSENTERT